MCSWSLVREQEPCWCLVADEKSPFEMPLFYTRVRRNSVFFLCFSHGVLPRAVGCRVVKVDSWVLSEVSKLQ